MTDELFEVPEQLSPRLKWMKRHGIYTDHCGQIAKHVSWKAYVLNERGGIDLSSYGETEHEAIADLAIRLGIKLWNEEGAK